MPEIDKKREEIREGIQHQFCQHCRAIQKVLEVVADCWYNPLDRDMPAFCASNEDYTEELFKSLHSQRVRIEVDRELSNAAMEGQISYSREDYAKLLGEDGYVAVEPLIKE